jgi:hypothetical protein
LIPKKGVQRQSASIALISEIILDTCLMFSGDRDSILWNILLLYN